MGIFDNGFVATKVEESTSNFFSGGTPVPLKTSSSSDPIVASATSGGELDTRGNRQSGTSSENLVVSGKKTTRQRRGWVSYNIRKDTEAIIYVAKLGKLLEESTTLSEMELTRKFLLSRVVRSDREKVQILETFGGHHVYFYGRRPRIFTYSGMLPHLEYEDDWFIEFLEHYENDMRGTKLIANKARVILAFDRFVHAGYMLSLSTTQDAVFQNAVPFSFEMLVTNERLVKMENPSP